MPERNTPPPEHYQEPQRVQMEHATRVFGSKTRFFMLRMLIFILFLIAVGWWGYTQVMSQLYGHFELFSWNSPPPSNIPTGWNEKPRIILINPVRTERFLRQQDRDTTAWPYVARNDNWPLADTLWYAPPPKRKQRGNEVEAWNTMGDKSKENIMIEYWREALPRMGYDFRVVQEPGLMGDLDPYTVMIIPGALLLSTDEKRSIKDFVARGGNLLGFWAMGTRDEFGQWVGFDFLSQLIGASTSHDAVDSSGSSSIILRGESPITAMIPPGTHLDFFTYNGNTTMEVKEERAASAGCWFKPYWKEPYEYKQNDDAMIVYGRYVFGKFVWFSFTSDAVQDSKDNKEILYRMLNNSISWLHGHPVVNVNVWPTGYHSGASMIVEARGGGSDALNVLSLLNQQKVAADLMIDPELPPTPEVLKEAPMADFILNAGLSARITEMSENDQERWMGFRSRRIKQVVGKSPVGVYFGNWQYGDATLDASIHNDFKFVLANESPRFYGPQNHLIKAGGWWIFSRMEPISAMPKCVVSYREWYETAGLRGDLLDKAMGSDLDRVADVGGAYVGIIDPTSAADHSSGAILSFLSAHLDSAKVWRASTRQLMDRFAGWEDLRASTKIISKSRIRVGVSNEGKINLADVSVRVHLTSGFADVRASSEIVGKAPTSVTWNREEGYCDFRLSTLGAGDNIAVYLDLYGSSGGGAGVVTPSKK